jgi:3-deoxy-D-manno-octulosonic-acid transferase
LLKVVAVFNKKFKLFVEGRKNVFKQLEAQISQNDRIIWFHCASLGEFEQGRPIIERAKSQYPSYKILLTFFSPSGFEGRKNYAFADVIKYLPLDTKSNAKKFVEKINPEIVIFVKYEFWPNILRELKNKNIKTILVSGIFREDQSFFKWYGSWMRNSLKTFNHFFVQNATSKELLNDIGFNNITISGDTRFDRVSEITKQNNQIEEIEKFIDNKYTLVAGSTWPKDEELLVEYINNQTSDKEKFIIAPHNINPKEINELKSSITKNTLLFSDKKNQSINDAQVLIIDTIGILTKIYSYANVAYVGGGFGSGIHNILEPATFGIPIIIGPNYQKFNEAIELINLGACLPIQNSTELNTHLNTLFHHKDNRELKGKSAKDYILNNVGATKIIIAYLDKISIKK